MPSSVFLFTSTHCFPIKHQLILTYYFTNSLKVTTMKRLTFLFTLFLLVFANVARGQSTDPFINEVNYKASDPAQRGAEVAGPADTEMDGWSIVSYRPNGTVASTRPIGSGTIPDIQNGHGSIWYDVEQSSQPTPGGGSGGGLALVRPDGTVAQFVSYGKNLIFNIVITATNGPAAGMTSQHIGTQLLSGSSLQLTGIGLEYLDFIWALPGGSTPGQINTFQIFGLLEDLLNGVLGLLLVTDPDLNPTTQETLSALESQLAGDGHFDVVVYPNPVADNLQIKLGQPLEEATAVRIIDANGRVVRSDFLAPLTSTGELDMKDLVSGYYALQLATPNGMVTKIILKQ